nr:zinc finger, CCHC-type [Tanacetum cinerariifolium]
MYREDSNEAAFAVAVVENIYAHESLTFNDTVACEVISKWKAGLKKDMDVRSNVYVLSNGYRKCSDDSDGYYWEYTPGMFIHLFLYIDDMVFSCGCKAEIWATKGLLDKAKGNVLGDYDVEKNGKWSCIYAVGSQEYQMVCTRLDIASTDVGMLDNGIHDVTEAWKKKIWLKALLTESRYELRLVAGIATGALVKGGSRSEVPAQVEVAAYRC